MAYGSESKHEEVVFTPIKPHFFKVILDDAIQSEKLVIPKRFVEKYGNQLTDSVVLKIPSGANWHVDLIKSDGEVWLSKGWQEFAKNYHLERGHFVVFEYEMSSCFSVVIFDPSATEIDYPCSRVNGANEPNLDGKYEVEETEEPETKQLHKRKSVKKDGSQLPCERPHKRKRGANLARYAESISKLHKSNSPDDARRSCSWKTRDTTRSLTYEEKEEALQRVEESFKSENPFFMVVMQPKYIHDYYLRIPFKFAKKHLHQNLGQVTLQVNGGRSWTIGTNMLSCIKEATFSSRWRAFAQDIKLKIGDVVIFELIDDTKLVFNVIIYRAVEDVKCSMPLGSNTRSRASVVRTIERSSSKNKRLKKRAGANMQNSKRSSCSIVPRHVESANRFSSGNPSFKVVNGRWNFYKSSVRLPQEFTNEHVKEKSQAVELQVADRVWPMKLNIYRSFGAVLCSGWGTFARDNDLKVGDVCVYELIQKDPMVFYVYIVKNAG